MPVFERPLRVSSESVTTTELELALLRALCTQPQGEAEHIRIVNQLKDYQWEGPDHRVIYEALVEIKSADTEILRRQLPAATARMGFPDIDWERYFSPPSISTEIDKLIRALRRHVKPATGPTA